MELVLWLPKKAWEVTGGQAVRAVRDVTVSATAGGAGSGGCVSLGKPLSLSRPLGSGLRSGGHAGPGRLGLL